MSKLATKTVKLGDSADLSKNFLISVPAVPDGTLRIERESGALVASIDASGKVAFPGNIAPAFSVLRGASNQSITASAYVKVQLNSVTFDSNNAFDAVTNYRFQPQVAGYYQFNAVVTFGWASAPVEVAAAIQKNGVESIWSSATPTTTQVRDSVSLSGLIYMNGTTDYVELFGYCNATTPVVQSAVDRTQFSGFLARAA